jgi:PAS domain S-box-containing protein
VATQPAGNGAHAKVEPTGTDVLPSRSLLLETFFQCVREIYETPDLERAVCKSFELIGHLVPARRIGMFEIYYEALSGQDMVNFLFEWHLPELPDLKPNVPQLPASLFPGWTALVSEHQPILLGNSLPDSLEWPFPDLELEYPLLVLPVPHKDKLWGIIAIELAYQQPRYPKQDRKLFYQLASVLSSGVIRRRLEEQLERSENAYRMALEEGRVSYWTLDVETKRLTPDNYLLEMLGYDPDEIAEPWVVWRTYVHPDDLITLDQRMFDFLSGRLQDYEVPHRLRRKDGSWLWLLSRARKIYDNQGVVRRVIGSNIDIDRLKLATQELEARIEQQNHDLRTAIEELRREVEERMRSERALKRSRANLQAFFNNPNQLYLLVDRKLTILEINAAFQQAMEQILDMKVVPGMNLAELFPPEYRGELLANLARLFAGEGPIRGERSALGHWVEYSWATVEDEDNEVQAACLTVAFVDDRMEARMKLEQSERLFRTLIQNSEGIILRLDANGRILYVSESIRKFLGYSTDGITAENPFDYLKREEFEEANEFLAKLVANEGTSQQITLQVRDSKGLYRYMEIDGTNYLNDPAIRSLVLNLRDVTSRREAEERLLRYHELLISIFSQSADAFFVLEIQHGRIIDCNQKAIQVFDARSRLDVLHTSIDRFVGRIEGKFLLELLAEKPEGFPLQLETELRTLQGRIFFASFSAKVIRAGSDRVVMLRVNDITATKQAQRELFLLRSAIEYAQDPILIAEHLPHESTARITYTNPAFEALTGYTPEESRGRNPLRLLRGDNIPDYLREQLTRMLNEQIPMSFSIECFRKDGTSYYSEWKTSPVKTEEGKTTHWVAVQRDLTERLALEAESRLQQQRMATAVVEAQENERRRIAGDLHDGQGQLLSVIKLQFGELESLLAHVDGPHQPLLAKARELIDKAAADLRGISRSLMPSELEDFGLVKGLTQLCQQFQSTAGVQVNFQSHGPLGRYDRNVEITVYRIAQEALNNALKHARAQEINLQLTVDEDQLLLIVEDDGIGFSPEETQEQKGGGMGLNNMQARASLVGGHLSIDSVPEHGTTVVLEIPLHA